jgi:hypothetical protein
MKEDREHVTVGRNKSKVRAKNPTKSRANVRIKRNNALEYYKILADNSFHSESDKERKVVLTKKPNEITTSTAKTLKGKVQKKTPDNKRANDSDIHSDSTPITNNSKNPGESNPDDTTGIKKNISLKEKSIKANDNKKETKEKTRSEGKDISIKVK